MLLFIIDGSSLFKFFIFALAVHMFDSVFLSVHNLKEEFHIIKILHRKISDSIWFIDFAFF